MLDLTPLLTFSHTYCIAICAVLVPLNLLFTLLTFVLLAVDRPKAQVDRSIGLAIVCALLMVLHVETWLMVGVVRIQTFILFALGLCCLILNLWALGHPSSLRRVIKAVVQWAMQVFRSMVQRVQVS
jgi:hypothetical protein